MKSIERRRKDFVNLLNDENIESVIEEMYGAGEIYERAENIGIEQKYENFKKMVNKQIKKRRIKNVARWLWMMTDYRDEIMVLFIEKYIKEEVDREVRKEYSRFNEGGKNEKFKIKARGICRPGA